MSSTLTSSRHCDLNGAPISQRQAVDLAMSVDNVIARTPVLGALVYTAATFLAAAPWKTFVLYGDGCVAHCETSTSRADALEIHHQAVDIAARTHGRLRLVRALLLAGWSLSEESWASVEASLSAEAWARVESALSA